MLKKDLRKKYKKQRENILEEDVLLASIKVANQLLKLPVWDKSYYHLFLPILKQKEIDTEQILHVLYAKNKEIVVSKSNFKMCTMSHYLLTENTKIKTNTYGIPEPIDGLVVPVDKIDVVFVPLLAFDVKGNRVGYGKGFYDKFLNNCDKKTIKIGLSFFEAELNITDVNHHDIALDYCVTPDKIYSFNA